jgi:hypothetical protein
LSGHDCPGSVGHDCTEREGWRPPARIITTVNELESLPIGTVIRQINPATTLNNYGEHLVAEIDGDETEGFERRGLLFMGWDYNILRSDSEILPAVILWEPTP